MTRQARDPLPPGDREWVPPEPLDAATRPRVGGAARLGLVLAALGVVAFGVNAVTGDSGGGATASPTIARSPDPPEPAGGRPTPFPSSALWLEECEEELGGLVLTGSPAPRGVPHEAWNCRPDPAGRQGTVLRRFGDGSLARASAVVVWPLPAAEVPAETVPPEGLLRSDGRVLELVVDVGTGHARIRGDLPAAELRAIARGTLVQNGYLQVGPPDGFVKVTGLRYTPPLLHEVRYGAAAVGLEHLIGDRATVVTGLLRTALLEDELLAGGSSPAGRVRGRPAVAGLGGRLVAWEPEAGYTAYVMADRGSGASVSGSPELIRALLELAQRARLVSPQGFGRLSAG